MKEMTLILMALIAVSTVSFAEFNPEKIETTEIAYNYGIILKHTGKLIDDCEKITKKSQLIRDCKKGWQEQQNYIVPRSLPLGNNR